MIKFFTNNILLKFVSLIIALAIWFYIVGELNKGTEEERKFLQKVLPAEGLAAKKLPIRPVIVGKPRYGYYVDDRGMRTVPDYCIVVGTRDIVGNIRYAYTMPIDVAGLSKAFTKSVALSPIAPGIFMDETLVQVTIPVEKSEQ